MKTGSRVTLWVILSSATLTIMAGAIIAPVLNLMRDDLQLKATSAGLIITTHSLFVALFSPVAGYLIDRFGTRKPFVIGLLLYGLAGGSGLFISSYRELIIGRAFLGIAVAAIVNSIAVMILNLYKGRQRDAVMGWRTTANSSGGVLWSLLGGGLGSISWHLPFGAYLLGIPFGILAFFTVPETRKAHINHASQQHSVWLVVQSHPILFVLFGLIFWAMMLLYTLVVFLPPLLEKLGITQPFAISVFLSVMGLTAGLTALIYHRIRARLSYKLIILSALALWTLGMVMLAQVPAALPIIVAVSCIGIGHGLLFPAAMVWTGEIVEPAYRGRIISYLGMSALLGQFLSPIIQGQVAVMFGLNAVFLLPAALCIGLFAVILLAMKS